MMNKRRAGLLAAVLLVFVLLAVWYLRPHRDSQAPKPALPSTDTVKQEPLAPRDVRPVPPPKMRRAIPKNDSARVTPVPQDTVPPYCYAGPSGGLFYDSVRVDILADEPCSIFFKTGEMPGYSVWREPILLRANDELTFYTMDSSGNVSVSKSELYDVQPGGAAKCPPEMASIPSPGGAFCIDRYEWPNRKGVLPQAMITYHTAQESCASIGKKLCSAQQWHLACIGKQTTRFAYGDAYEPRACNTNGVNPAAAGAFAECRSYYGPMDMNGNLREWTSSRSTENPRFNDVRGGYWNSRSQSGCEESQYSFYPQNRHLSVGFRCCK